MSDFVDTDASTELNSSAISRRTSADVVYVIATTYEQYKDLVTKYVDAPWVMLYVYNPKVLPSLQPPVFDLVNIFSLANVALPDERLWVNGLLTYTQAAEMIAEVVDTLRVVHNTRVHASMEAFAAYLNEVRKGSEL